MAASEDESGAAVARPMTWAAALGAEGEHVAASAMSWHQLWLHGCGRCWYHVGRLPHREVGLAYKFTNTNVFFFLKKKVP